MAKLSTNPQEYTPMQKERINLTLSLDTIQAITDLAEVTGRSKSALLDEMVQSSIPTLKASTAILRKAQYLRHQATQIIAHDFDQARQNAESIEKTLRAQIYDIDKKINRNSGKKLRLITPITNRGVKIHD
jgi:hypothetical protein